MLALGIDPGTATTGYGLVQLEPDGTLRTVDYGVILTPATDEMPERLKYIHQQLEKLIYLHHPETGAVEKLFFQKNVRTAMSVGQARGVTLLTLAENDVSIFEYSPLEVKQSVTGYGGADKKQVQQMVQILLNLPEIPTPDDAADALAIAICHLYSTRRMELIERSVE